MASSSISMTTNNSENIVRIPRSKIEKIDFAQCNQPTETLESYYDRQTVKPTVLMNGGLFNVSNGVPVLNFIDNKISRSWSKSYTEGMESNPDIGLVLKNLDDYLKGEVPYDFISGYPVLIKKGNKVPITYAHEINYKAYRTVIGYSKDEVIGMCLSKKVQFEELQNILIREGVENAINLDGGGSTRMLFNGKKVCGSLWSRPVDNVIAFYCKPDDKIVVYRVQLGAFSHKSNAENYLEEIKKLPPMIGLNYKNAYIRMINGLYKVQVGAFSNLQNADSVLADLRSKGYSPFISKDA